MAVGEGSGAAGVIVDQGGRPLELQAHNTAQKPPLPWIYISCHPCTVQYSNLANIPTATASYTRKRNKRQRSKDSLRPPQSQLTHADARSQHWVHHQPAGRKMKLHGVGTRYNISFGLYIPTKAQPQTAPPSACAGTGRDVSLDRVEIRYFLRCVR